MTRLPPASINEKELARLLRKSLPNILQDEAEHAAEVITIYLQSKGIKYVND